MEELKLKITNTVKHIADTPSVNDVNKFSEVEKQKIAGTSKDFESMLTGLMIKSMTSSVNGFFGEGSYGGDYFDSIFTMELAKHISNNTGLGLAEQIYQKVTGEHWDDSLLKFDSKLKLEDLQIKSKIKTENTDESGTKPGLNSEAITPSSSSLKRLERYDSIIEDVSEKFEVDHNLIKSIILAESAGNPDAVSKAKAKGLMQLMDLTAKDMGVKNVYDPVQNISGGTKYFTQLLRKYNGDIHLSLAAYNAGPENVKKYGGIPPFEETQNYVNKVLGFFNYLST